MARDSRRNQSARRGSGSTQALCRSVPVDRVRDGTADTGVVERRPPRVEAEIPRERPARALHEGLVVCDGSVREHRLEDVVLAAPPPVGRSGRRGFQLERHLGDVSAGALPARGGRDHDVVLIAGGQDERAVPDERVRAVPVSSLALADVPGPGEE
jgi:hypothetical protein